MKRLSLTARLSLMFMLAVSCVLGAAGVFFQQLSQHHFDELDRQTLEEKVQASREMLHSLDDLAGFDRLRPQLQALLGGHSDLAVRILDADGQVRFAARGDAASAGGHGHGAAAADDASRVWRRRAAVVEVAGQPLRIELALDVTTHRLFFHTLMGWLWTALAISALLSGLLGWLLARRGLRPLQ